MLVWVSASATGDFLTTIHCSNAPSLRSAVSVETLINPVSPVPEETLLIAERAIAQLRLMRRHPLLITLATLPLSIVSISYWHRPSVSLSLYLRLQYSFKKSCPSRIRAMGPSFRAPAHQPHHDTTPPTRSLLAIEFPQSLGSAAYSIALVDIDTPKHRIPCA